jgi:hypothetical protein
MKINAPVPAACLRHVRVMIKVFLGTGVTSVEIELVPSNNAKSYGFL